MRSGRSAGGFGWLGQTSMAAVTGAAIALLLPLVRSAPSPRAWIPWLPVSLLVLWRFGWALVHWTRSAIYRGLVYPRLARRARAVVARRGGVSELAILVATFKERPEITRAVFGSIAAELRRVASGLARPPILIAVTGSDDDDRDIRAALEESPGPAELRLLRGPDGKRAALADGLTALRRLGLAPDGAFVMMDGDTELLPGCLERCLPLLGADARVAALTTDEHAAVRGPRWVAEWLHLRFGLRHLHAASISLSRRLLCLTGRCSVFRGAVLDDDFIRVVRSDTIDDWIWGRYQLLSGDDKSTWFHLLSRGHHLLYVPDARVITHEEIRGSAVLRAYHNLRRWGGNMVRNSGRALRLGPRRIGLFTWWCVLDQRLSMWTSLVGPTGFVLMTASGRWPIARGYLLWVILTRLIRNLPAWHHGRRVSFFYAPLSAVFDWAGALVKIWVVFFPARQFWHNRGERSLDSTAGAATLQVRRAASGLLLVAALAPFAVGVACSTGAVRFSDEPTSNASASVTGDLLERRVIARALLDDPAMSPEDWDAAAQLGLGIRARVVLLRAGLGDEDERRQIHERARRTADRLLAREQPIAGGPRGWGTARPILLPPLVLDHVVDAYTTAAALGGLADLAAWAIASGDVDEARRLDRAVAPVVDEWLGRRRFAAPGGGSSFEKVATALPAARGFVVHNTDAMFARDLLVLAGVAEALGDGARALAYREIAGGVARRIVELVVAPVLEKGAATWAYGLHRIGPEWFPFRAEDSTHASFVLDLLSLLAERGELPRRQLEALGSLLPFIAGADGAPAIRVFVAPGDVTSDARGKRRARAFGLERTPERSQAVVTWRRELGGDERTIDFGASIRSSWGWTRAARADRALVSEVGKYLVAAQPREVGSMSGSLFLSLATWLEVSRCLSQ